MAEWLKARASKACIPLRVSGVRIPLSPPYLPEETRLKPLPIPGNAEWPYQSLLRAAGAALALSNLMRFLTLSFWRATRF